METVAKTLLVFALMLGIAGVVLLLFSRLGISRLPGDVVIDRKNVTVYFPLGPSIVISLLLTLF
jgi:prepilin signal peptidase PulO-like enzyme (type II secretory pathway)